MVEIKNTQNTNCVNNPNVNLRQSTLPKSEIENKLVREDKVKILLTSGEKLELPIKNRVITREDIKPYRDVIKEVVIPDSVTEIGGMAFWDCASLTNVVIPKSVTYISEFAFKHCTGLTNVKIPDSVEVIDKFAFSGCISLTNVTIPNSVTTIGLDAFHECINLTKVLIPESVMNIGEEAFRDCENLKEIWLPNGIRGYDRWNRCAAMNVNRKWLEVNEDNKIHFYAAMDVDREYLRLNEDSKIRFYEREDYEIIKIYLEIRDRIKRIFRKKININYKI